MKYSRNENTILWSAAKFGPSFPAETEGAFPLLEESAILWQLQRIMAVSRIHHNNAFISSWKTYENHVCCHNSFVPAVLFKFLDTCAKGGDTSLDDSAADIPFSLHTVRVSKVKLAHLLNTLYCWETAVTYAYNAECRPFDQANDNKN